MDKATKTAKKLTHSIFLAIILLIVFCVTTYALYSAKVTVKENYFKTGIIDIDLNGGYPVIENDYLFEPGMTVEKSFYIQNKSTWDVYYKIYFDNVEGELGDVLEITILDGDKILCRGTANELTRENVTAFDDVLKVDERRDLTIRFYFDEASGNDAQAGKLKFDLCADAVQEKNNPEKIFD
ncbi:MAG: hypothetical protein IKT56_00705 [Clostridia bacterium]|nr:hypothetical protein [Clostridia bacterium]